MMEKTTIGERVAYGAASEPFGLGEARLQHVHIIGQSGAGKSTLMVNMVLADIREGRGVALIDPHGELASFVLERIPRWRTHHVLYVNPQDERYPVPMNPLSMGGRPHLVASALVRALRSFWAESWGPRMEYILRQCLRTLIEAGNSSLLGVNRLLLDSAYRERMTRRCRSVELRRFWEEVYAAWPERQRSEYILPIVNKVDRFSEPPLRSIIGQASNTYDLKMAMDGQKIVIANLARGAIGADTSNLLGSLLATMIEETTYTRATGGPPFFLYIDESPLFTTKALAEALPQCRKFGLAITTCSQHTGQMSPEMSAALFGNVGTLIAFRTGGRDARQLSEEFSGEIPGEAFTALDNFEAYLRPVGGMPLRLRAYPPRYRSLGRSRVIIERSRRQFAREAHVVDDKLRRWMSNL